METWKKVVGFVLIALGLGGIAYAIHRWRKGRAVPSAQPEQPAAAPPNPSAASRLDRLEKKVEEVVASTKEGREEVKKGFGKIWEAVKVLLPTGQKVKAPDDSGLDA